MSNHWYSKLGDHDQLHFGNANSWFIYRPNEKYIPLFQQFYDLTFVEGSTFHPSTAGGDVWNMIPPQTGRRISDLVLQVTLPALAPAGLNRANGDVACYENDIMHALMERIEMVDGADVVETIYPEFEHWWKQVTKRNETREDRTLLGWYDTIDDLNDAAAAPQTLYWTIPFHFSGTTLDRALRIDELVSHDFRFRFYWRPWSSIYYENTGAGSSPEDAGPAAGPVNFSGIKVVATYYPISTPEKALYRKEATFRTLTIKKKAPYAISNATTTWNIPLNNFTFPIAAFLIRIEDNRAADTPNSLWQNSDCLSQMGLTVDGQKRFELRDVRFWMDVLMPKMFPSLADEAGWYFLSLTPQPMLLPEIVTGSINMSQCNDVTLDLVLDAAKQPVSGYVHIYALLPNFFQYIPKGDTCTLKPVFK